MKKYKFKQRPFYQLVVGHGRTEDMPEIEFKNKSSFERLELCVVRAIKILEDGGVHNGVKASSISIERCVYEEINDRVFVLSSISVDEMLRAMGYSSRPTSPGRMDEIREWLIREPRINFDGKKITASELLRKIGRGAEDALDACVATWSIPTPTTDSDSTPIDEEITDEK